MQFVVFVEFFCISTNGALHVLRTNRDNYGYELFGYPIYKIYMIVFTVYIQNIYIIYTFIHTIYTENVYVMYISNILIN